jgi:intracellular septation protein
MQAPSQRAGALRSVLLAGLVPVVVFTVIEETYGVVAGLIAGMVFGVGEIVWEKWRQGRVQTMTWIGNGMLLGLGGVSLLTQEGYWFKLQPAILEGAFMIALIGSVAIGRPAMLEMSKAQGTWAQVPPERRALMDRALRGMTLRMGLFFGIHAVLTAWAALHWSTRAWGILKGVGFTLSMLVYLGLEVLVLRRRLARGDKGVS